jgi:hypothetical protein
MRPLLIISRHTVDADLRLFGISKENCKIRHQTSNLVDGEIFKGRMMKMLIPEVVKPRQKAHCTRRGCILGSLDR